MLNGKSKSCLTTPKENKEKIKERMVGFGKNLAKKRKELHFSQDKLSEKLELCAETIKNYERGEGILLNRAYKIADFLDIPLQLLLFKEQPSNQRQILRMLNFYTQSLQNVEEANALETQHNIEFRIAKLGENICKERRKQKMSRRQLAEKANLSDQTINSIEGKRLWPSDKTMIKIANALETDACAFFLPENYFSNKATDNIIIPELKSALKKNVEYLIDGFFSEYLIR